MFVNKSYIQMLERQNQEFREEIRKLTNVICQSTNRLVPFHEAVNGNVLSSGRKTLHDITRELEARHAVQDDELEQ